MDIMIIPNPCYVGGKTWAASSHALLAQASRFAEATQLSVGFGTAVEPSRSDRRRSPV